MDILAAIFRRLSTMRKVVYTFVSVKLLSYIWNRVNKNWSRKAIFVTPGRKTPIFKKMDANFSLTREVIFIEEVFFKRLA